MRLVSALRSGNGPLIRLSLRPSHLSFVSVLSSEIGTVNSLPPSVRYLKLVSDPSPETAPVSLLDERPR